MPGATSAGRFLFDVAGVPNASGNDPPAFPRGTAIRVARTAGKLLG
jgi:hypothetical protein